jgi:hypothetical protein
MSLPPLGLLPLLPRLPTVMMNFPFHVSYIVLLWFLVMVMLRFLPCAPAFLAFAPLLPLLLFALNLLFALRLPRKLAATADALSGMVDTDLLLLLSIYYRWINTSILTSIYLLTVVLSTDIQHWHFQSDSNSLNQQHNVK